MQKHVWIIALTAAVGLIASVPASGQDAQPSAGSAYAGLSAETYIERLRDLGMVELAEAYVAGLAERGWEPLKVRRLLADLQILKALRIEDEERRNFHLDKAVAMYSAILDEMHPTDYIERTEAFDVQLQLLSTIVNFRTKVHVDRLEVLRGSQADRDDLLALLDEHIHELEDLVDDVGTALDRVHTQGAGVYVRINPRLVEMHLDSKYTLAWAYLHYARAYSPQDDAGMRDRDVMLQDAIDIVRQFAEDERFAVRWHAMLLIGICQREQGRYDQAFDTLSALAGNNLADNIVRAEATFELCRVRAEQGRLAEALSKAEVYQQEAANLIGGSEGTDNWINFNTAMLGYHAHVEAARAAPDEDQRQAELQAAQQVLKEFIQDDWDDGGLKAAIYRELALMYRDREDFEAFPSIFLLAKGAFERMKGTPEGNELALVALDMLLGRNDPSATSLHTWARTERAAIISRDQLTSEQALEFLELARRDLTDPQAMTWVQNAVYIMDTIVTEQRAAGAEAEIRQEDRQLLIEVTRLLLSRQEWLEQEPRFASFCFDLGWNTAQLAAAAEDPQTQIDLYTQAVEDYENVPAALGDQDNTFNHMDARTMALELRRYLLLLNEGAAEDVRRMLREYASDARRAAAGTPDEERREQMIIWGSEAAFHAASLSYDPLNSDRADLELRQIAEDWPGTDVVTDSAKLEIQIYVERGNVTKAIDRMNEFLADNPSEGEYLIALVVEQIRDKIADLRYGGADAERLESLQTNYHKLAGTLFSRVADQDIADRYRRTQMYAESFLEVDQPTEAYELFQQCQAYRQSQSDMLLERLERENAVKLEELRRVERINDIAEQRNELRRLTDEFLASVENEGVSLVAIEGEMDEAWGKVHDNADQNAGIQREDLARVVRILRQGYRDLYERSAPIDPNNDYGLARCLSALGEHEAAALAYYKLVRGINSEAHPQLYWSIQLERVRSSLEAYADDHEKLADLLRLVDQIGLGSRPKFGGPPYDERFKRLRNRIVELLDQPAASD